MQDEQLHEEHYRKGFNEGYLITKHLPALSDELSTVTNATPRIEGFQDGRKQCVLEQVRERRHAKTKDHTQTNENDKTRDKDIEPER